MTAEVREVRVNSDAALERALAAVPAWREVGEAVDILLEPGNYRNPLHLSGTDPTADAESPPQLTIRARLPGSVVFTEGIVLEDWSREDFRTWTHAIPDSAMVGSGVRLFYDGTWLTPAISRERMNLWEYLPQPEEQRILVAIPDGAPVEFSRFRLATRNPQAVLLLYRMENVVLRGLVFSHDFPGAAGRLFDSPHVAACRSIVLEDCRFLWNKHGLRIQDSDGVQVLDCRFQFNGEQGLTVMRSASIAIRGAVMSHNSQLEPKAIRDLPFGYALVLEHLRGPHEVARSRIHDNASGVFIREGNGHPLALSHLVIGHHRSPGFGLVAVGHPARMVGRDLRIGRNGGPSLFLDLEERETDAYPARFRDSIFFEVEGESVLEVHRGALELQSSIIESRSPSGGLLRTGDQGFFHGRENLYFHPTRKERLFDHMDFKQWALDPVREQGSRFADPQFLNTETLDFDMDFSSPWFQTR